MKALVLSGGGEKGPYQVGALRYLSKHGYEPDIICGTSVGALNGAYLAQYPMGQFHQGVDNLADVWRGMTNEKVWKHWFPPYITIPWKYSALNSEPLWELIDSLLNVERLSKSGRKLRVVSVSMNTTKLVVGTEKDDDIKEHIKASSAYPNILRPVVIGDDLCTDGGLRDVTPIRQAMDAGAKEMVVIMCSNPDLPDNWNPDSGITRFVSCVMRTIDIMVTEIVANDPKTCGLMNELAVLDPRYKLLKVTTIKPTQILDTKVLEFSSSESERLMKIGYEDARKAVQ